MKCVIQRVQSSSIRVVDQLVAEIGKGLVVLLGVQPEDSLEIADKMLHKIVNMRLFADDSKRMNLSLKDVQGDLLVVSQFTLVANLKGNRPSFSQSAKAHYAEVIYNYFSNQARHIQRLNKVATGIFAADMQLRLINDGPVTIVLEY